MRKGMSEMNDIFQVDYEPEHRTLKINLPEEIWEKIDHIIMTRHFQELKKIRVFHRESDGKRKDCPLKAMLKEK
jgi:4-hydroxyphenylpyruvate dioxygenase-like putative hemolysin